MILRNLGSSSAFWSIFLHVILLLCSIILLQPSSTLVSALSNETDKFALHKLKESFDDPDGALNSWNDSVHFCNWRGISCARRHQRITGLNLEGYNLRGIISPFIGNLSFLRFFYLGSNFFTGEIPSEVDRLFRLQRLNLSYNMLEGIIPLNLSYCSDLQVISLESNYLTGMISGELGSLMKLKILFLDSNNLTGGIPPSLGNISTLNVLSLVSNNLVGTVPDDLGRLKSLTGLVISDNNLFGTIPFALYNISSIENFFIAFNKFTGTLPSDIGHKLHNLRQFSISATQFSGVIPESFSNASQLLVLDFSDNDFVGQVPSSLGKLLDLQELNLSNYSSGSYSAKSLGFVTSLTNCTKMTMLGLSYNNFGGVLPKSVANLSTQLTELYLGSNQISGSIPATLGNLVNLIILSMPDNLFVGVIPHSLGKLTKLQVLDLPSNSLSGYIPLSIGNLTQVYKILLFHNKLEGSIPPSIASCQTLQILDISENCFSGDIPREVFGLSFSVVLYFIENSFTGSLPLEVGNLKDINVLGLSENNLTGEIPKSIQGCESLEFLYLEGNLLQGTLPSTLASLKGLRCLDLSRNNFTGPIPKDLEKLSSLSCLNLSFNDLEGEVPKKGVFQNISAISVAGNTKLCGGVPELLLPACPVKESKHKKIEGHKLITVMLCVAAVLLLLSALAIYCWRKKLIRKLSPTISTINFFSKISYRSLYQATSGFSPSMLIGTGSFGSVYKGILDDEEVVAIKVLNLQQKGASKSFLAECNALRDVRHRNLVKILTCCSSMDYKGNEFKALIFQYMPNGSLEKWLNLVTKDENRSTSLSLIQRLNIAADVASAVHYLHHHCYQPIIHCDLKPSNVLLDDEMIAHVSDFGLARLMSDDSDSSGRQSSTIGIKGTIGYAPPEYAMGGEPSRQGDVYSYGILILEMFTGRRPTDEIFKDSFNLHNFVKTALPEKLMQAVDPTLLLTEVEETTTRREDEERNYNNIQGREIDAEGGNINSGKPNRIQISTKLHKCLFSILDIGLACSEESPNKRMSMEDVIMKIQHIENAYMGERISGERPRNF